MRLLYEISILFYAFLIRIISPFNAKAKQWVSGRKNLFESLPDVNEKEVIWFHCASLGEFDQALPLMNKIKSENPSIFLLTTFFSPSGFSNYHKRNHLCDFVTYLPIDTKRNARRFVEHFSPTKSFFVKYEFWANYIFTLKRNNSSIYNVSGIFRETHHFFKWHGGFFRKVLKEFDYFFVQNEESLKLLASIGINNVIISGDSRYDRVLANKENLSQNKIIEKFKSNSRLMIAGSTWNTGEEIISKWVNEWDGKLILAPHNIDENHINDIQKLFPKSIRYSKINDTINISEKILILDTIGHLTNAYQYADIAYVGGGFSGKLHNILEPSVFNIPVLFGPKHKRFPEAQTFIDQNAGFEIANETDLSSQVNKVIQVLPQIRENSIQIFKKNKGATLTIYHKIFGSL